MHSNQTDSIAYQPINIPTNAHLPPLCSAPFLMHQHPLKVQHQRFHTTT